MHSSCPTAELVFSLDDVPCVSVNGVLSNSTCVWLFVRSVNELMSSLA